MLTKYVSVNNHQQLSLVETRLLRQAGLYPRDRVPLAPTALPASWRWGIGSRVALRVIVA